MGYDTRLHIGELYDWTDDNTISRIAVIELCVVGGNSHTGRLLSEARENPEGPFYTVYGERNEEGTEATSEDCYGKKLTAVDLDDLIGALNRDVLDSIEEGVTPYRRFVLALKLLRGIKAEKSWRNIRVVQYGH